MVESRKDAGEEHRQFKVRQAHCIQHGAMLIDSHEEEKDKGREPALVLPLQLDGSAAPNYAQRALCISVEESAEVLQDGKFYAVLLNGTAIEEN